jgi:hypothetical protein
LPRCENWPRWRRIRRRSAAVTVTTWHGLPVQRSACSARDAAWLAASGGSLTTSTSISLSSLPSRRAAEPNRPMRSGAGSHVATCVAMRSSSARLKWPAGLLQARRGLCSSTTRRRWWRRVSRFNAHHAMLCTIMLERIDQAHRIIGELSARVVELQAPHEAAVSLLIGLPRRALPPHPRTTRTIQSSRRCRTQHPRDLLAPALHRRDLQRPRRRLLRQTTNINSTPTSPRRTTRSHGPRRHRHTQSSLTKHRDSARSGANTPADRRAQPQHILGDSHLSRC